MRHRARVLQDAPAKAQVLVEIDQINHCARCAKGQGCGALAASALAIGGDSAVQLHCQTRFKVNQGQPVVVEFDENDDSRWLWLVLGAYGLPLAGLLTATALTAFILPAGQQNWAQAVAALLGMGSGLGLWRLMSARVESRLETGLCLQRGRIVSTEQPLAAILVET